MFVDETVITRKRSHATPKGDKAAYVLAVDAQYLQEPPFLSGDWILSQDMDLFALSYCYGTHIIRTRPEKNTELCVSDDKTLLWMKALGMASYATATGSPRLHQVARRYYVASLESLKSCLSTAAEAKQNSTLLAVLASLLFESLTGLDGHSVHAFAQHCRGLTALMQCRGLNSLDTAGGRHLFVQATMCLAADCMRTRRRIPAVIRDMICNLHREPSSCKHPPIQVLYLTVILTDLISDVHYCRIADPQSVPDLAFKLAKAFSDVFKEATVEWQYDIVACGRRCGSSFPAYVHVYRNLAAAQTYNGTRVGMMVCCSMLIVAMTKAQPSELPVYKEYRVRNLQDQIFRMQIDILATVPQNICSGGVFPYDTESTLAPSDPRHFRNLPATSVEALAVFELANTNIPVLGASRNMILTGQVALVGELAAPGSSMRKAACQTLRRIGRILGISQASVMAASLEQEILSCLVEDGALYAPSSANTGDEASSEVALNHSERCRDFLGPGDCGDEPC